VTRPLLLAAGAGLALAAAFAAGRWSGEPVPSAAPLAASPASAGNSAANAERRAAADAPPAPPAVPPSPDLGGGGQAATPALATAAVAQRTPLAPDVQERLRVEVSASLEERRRADLARCWPKGGLPMGQARATLTYDVTFDPAGREIARGVSDDRRAPAGELGRCLSRSPGAPLSIPPQGTSVSLRVQVAYP